MPMKAKSISLTYITRHYCEQQKSSITIIEPLNAEVEKCYSYWYLDNLAPKLGQ